MANIANRQVDDWRRSQSFCFYMTGYRVVLLVVGPLLGLWLLAACQPQVVTVEVTRLVETNGRPIVIATPAPPTEEALPASPEPEVTVITATVTVEVTRPPLGSAERPVQVLFPPQAKTAVIAERGRSLIEALEEATGVAFELGIPDSEQALVELLCAAPGDAIGFVSAAAYVLAHEQCGAQVGLVARHADGLTWEAGMLVTRFGTGLSDLSTLDGKRWALADAAGLPTALYFQAALADAGVEPGEVVEMPEESSALLSLFEQEADFTTAAFTPPIMPYNGDWTYGEDDPEVWRALGVSPQRSPIGYVVVAGEPEFGGYRLRDARARLFDTTPRIYDETRIIALSEPIPNETVVFGADFPLSLTRQTLTTLEAFADSEACQSSLCSADFYGWSGLEPIEDAAYDPIRLIIDRLDLAPADLWALLD